jgi:hypothetical protein
VWSFNSQHTTVTSLNYNKPFKIGGANESDDFHGRRPAGDRWTALAACIFCVLAASCHFCLNPLDEEVAASQILIGTGVRKRFQSMTSLKSFERKEQNNTTYKSSVSV